MFFQFFLVVILTFTSVSALSVPAPSSSLDSDSDIITGGFATYYVQNGLAGACGEIHTDADFVVAIDSSRYGSSLTSPLCGMQVSITDVNNDISAIATIVDNCPTCINANSFDLTLGLFQHFENLDDGLFPIDWYFL